LSCNGGCSDVFFGWAVNFFWVSRDLLYFLLFYSPPLAFHCSQLPGSTADLERHFSGAQFVGEGRERLSSNHLFQEVYIRENRRTRSLSLAICLDVFKKSHANNLLFYYYLITKSFIFAPPEKR
jgi:hypothetical protein